MNNVALIGRLTRDPEVRYTNDGKAIARFTIAIDRAKDKDGNKMTDFPSIVAFGKTAEVVEKWAGKGRLVGINGRIQTGSYEKDGKKVYTTDVVAERVELLDKSESNSAGNHEDDVPEGFSKLDEDIPF